MKQISSIRGRPNDLPVEIPITNCASRAQKSQDYKNEEPARAQAAHDEQIRQVAQAATRKQIEAQAHAQAQAAAQTEATQRQLQANNQSLAKQAQTLQQLSMQTQNLNLHNASLSSDVMAIHTEGQKTAARIQALQSQMANVNNTAGMHKQQIEELKQLVATLRKEVQANQRRGVSSAPGTPAPKSAAQSGYTTPIPVHANTLPSAQTNQRNGASPAPGTPAPKSAAQSGQATPIPVHANTLPPAQTNQKSGASPAPGTPAPKSAAQSGQATPIPAHANTLPSAAASTAPSGHVTPLAQASPPPSPRINPFRLATGFGNLSANCWANALLSMVTHVPHLKLAYLKVADHYASQASTNPHQIHGASLKGAIDAYQTALSQQVAVSVEITQKVRVAFHHFFGHTNPITQATIFSDNPNTQEDAYEAMQVLMGGYEEIMRTTNTNDPRFMPLYQTLQTSRHYRAVGEQRNPDATRLQRNDYSHLDQNNTSTLNCNDYQILLDLQNNPNPSFSALLSSYFYNTAVQNCSSAEYLLQNGKVQTFELLSEGRQFLSIPREFFLIIKRFGADATGNSYKITTSIDTPQTLSLPLQATLENRPANYELDSFIVHNGGTLNGHYICYKKFDQQWIEANDSHVRLVDTNEIDRILHGQTGTTLVSYIHHYKIT